MVYDNKGEMALNEYFRANYKAYVKKEWDFFRMYTGNYF